MEARFTEERIQSLGYNPRRHFGIARCPFCGVLLFTGYRMDGTYRVTHDSLPDPLHPGEFMTMCATFSALHRNTAALSQALRSAGVSWQKLVG